MWMWWWFVGVLFTRHPVTSNPAIIVINANYGLGEVGQQLVQFQQIDSFGWNSVLLNKFVLHYQKAPERGRNVKGF